MHREHAEKFHSTIHIPKATNPTAMRVSMLLEGGSNLGTSFRPGPTGAWQTQPEAPEELTVRVELWCCRVKSRAVCVARC
mgnify:CR=1 FL=1